jgi:D-glycero-alpha-D-manno-heptose-7-phosphate kinase
MIICRTPFRISFFGGGTDFPEYFERHGGAVLGTAIDKCVYHAVTKFPSHLFDYSIRLAYSKVETVRSVDEIEHRPFREVLRLCGVERDVEVGLTADLPSLSGLGSSSSFTVGLLHAIHAYQGRFVPQADLARLAIHVERTILCECVGCQDQVFAAHGGLNLVEFESRERIAVHRVVMDQCRLHELDDSLLLFYTGIRRRANEIEQNKLKNLAAIEDKLQRMRRLVDQAHRILVGSGPLSEFGLLLDATWQEKRGLDPAVSNPTIDGMYQLGKQAGALGGKLLGAGGGGFLLLFVPPERQPQVRQALGGFHEIEFTINAHGSSIIHAS